MNRKDLENYRNNKKWFEAQVESYTEQLQKIAGLKSVAYDGMPKGKNHTSYALEGLIDEELKILEYWKKQLSNINEVLMQLDRMENKLYRNILYYNYIEGYSLDRTAGEIGYSYCRTCTYNGLALNEFDKLDKK